MTTKNTKMKVEYVAVVFQGKKKLEETKFKTEKDMAYWLYKNRQYEQP